jgi:hypothetical protein
VLALSAAGAPRADALARATPTPQEAQRPAVEEDVEKLSKQTGVRPPVIDVQPLRDVLAEAGELIEQGRLGPNSRVDVTAKGERNDDGSLKAETVEFNWTTGSDEVAASLAERFVAALSRSKLFSVLEGAKEVSVRVSLGEKNALFTVAADVPSAERAAQLARGYGGMLLIASRGKEGTREGELYKSVKVSSEGRRFAFTFDMPKEDLNGIIADVLAKRVARGND